MLKNKKIIKIELHNFIISFQLNSKNYLKGYPLAKLYDADEVTAMSSSKTPRKLIPSALLAFTIFNIWGNLTESLEKNISEYMRIIIHYYKTNL